jgi:flagellin
MSIVIQSNIASLQAQKNLSMTQSALSSTFDKLSSGYRINTAADDAAGLAISESMQMQIRSFSVAERNANDAISMAQTAEGALGQVSTVLARMRELAMQGSNGSLQTSDRGFLDTEFTQLKDEIQRIQQSTTFNNQKLLATGASSVTFQVGINTGSSNQITVTFGNLDLSALLTTTSKVGGTAGNSLSAMTAIDNALKTVSTSRANYGAAMNRLDITTSNLETIRNNTSAANSRIRDVDVAEATSELSREQVLSQAGAAVLSQANQAPQLALSLLRG